MQLLIRLILFFTLVPLIELVLLLILADQTSWQFTLGLVLVTGFLGAWAARSQGTRALNRIRESLRNGEVPGDAVFDSALILVAGILLLTPGLFSDLLAIGILLPWTRPWFKRKIKSWFRVRVTRFGPPQQPAHSEVIDSYVISRKE